MDKMMEEGGLSTDGMDTDPVSGNDVPAGSNATEVRDDVDAKLSEGEYVVPADVVRYFGVGYFEKLRKKAKEALVEMESDGRMGGEPAPTAEEDLSPEEMDELTQVLNMANGGYVKHYADGGLETEDVKQQFLQGAMQPQTDWMQYSTPGSYVAAGRAAQQQQQQQQPATYVEYVGPNGQIMMVPVDVNGIPTIAIPEGFTKKPAVTAQQSAPRDDSDDHMKVRDQAQEQQAKQNKDWFDKFHAAEDPLAMAKALLEDKSMLGSLPGMLGSVIGSADTLSDIGRIRGYAASIEGSNPELAASLLAEVDNTIKNSNFGIKALEGIVASGSHYADTFSNYMAEETPATAARPGVRGAPAKRTTAQPSATYTQTSSPNAQKAADSLARRASDSGSSRDLGHIQRAQSVAQTAADTGKTIAEVGRAASPSNKGPSEADKAAAKGGATRDGGGHYGMAKGGLVERPAAKKTKAAKKPTNKKKGLGRK